MKFNFNTLELGKINFDNAQLRLSGIMVNDVSTINKPSRNSIVFIKNISDIDLKYLNNLESCLVIINSVDDIEKSVLESNDFIIVNNPRLAYAMVLKFILNNDKRHNKFENIGNNIYLGDNVILGKNVHIEPNVTIGRNVRIHDNTVILSGVRIGDNVIIGSNSVIRNNTVIGGQGFGIEKDQKGKTYRIPHLGSVIIGDNVDIGSLNTVVSGTIDPTVIENNVMTDDHVHIAHNCYIGEGTQITACVEISGSVKIGANSILGPNCSIMNKISLGENTIVGLGAVVTKSFKDNVILAGNPADTIENIKQNRNIIKKVIQEFK